MDRRAMHEGSARAILAALLANLGIAVAKLVGWLVTGSAAMLAESIHSLADTGNQGLLFLGGRIARRAPDREHPFGYGHERYFWAFVVALVLFSLGSLFAIYEGYEKIVDADAHSVEAPIVAIVILGVAIVLESFSMRTALVEAAELRGRAPLLRFIRRTKVPELPVVILEDFGALVGLVIAFVSLLLAWQVDPVFDGVGTVVIGLLLGVIAVLLAVEMKSLLIGEAASPEDVAAIRGAMAGHPDVDRVIHLRTEHLGADEVLVAAKVGLRTSLDLPGVARTIDEVERSVRSAVPSAVLIYLEPDLDRGAPAAEGEAPVP